MNDIKNLIFDFGGVVHNIRYENIGDSLVRHGVTNMEGFYSKDFQTHEMDLFEKGLITPSEFRDYIRKVTGKPFNDQTIDEITNAVLIDVPRERVDLLIRLRKRYKVFLFSNTNQINYDCFTSRLLSKYGFDIFTECFDKAYFSHFMHCRKPDPDGFRMIVREQQIDAAQTLFIDDIAKNLNGAFEVGMAGIHLDNMTICELFDEDGNLTVTPQRK